MLLSFVEHLMSNFLFVAHWMRLDNFICASPLLFDCLIFFLLIIPLHCRMSLF